MRNRHIIQLYWFGYKYCPNAGDYYGKWLLEKMGYLVHYSKKPEILVCGSILGLYNLFNEKTKIWGIGFHFDKQTVYIKNPNNIYAVRGKLSLQKLNMTTDIALGDPGLLLSVFFKPITKKKYDLCIVAHYIDYEIFDKRYADKYYVINMGINNIEKIANSINQCYFIFSSFIQIIL